MTTTTTSIKKLIPLLLLVFALGHLSAQDAIQIKETSIETILESNLLPKDFEIHTQTAAASGSAYIYQIGNGNVGSITANGGNSEVNLMQYGDANRADINVSGKSVAHNTLQKGNGNLFLEYGNASQLNLERTIIQTGDHQNVVIFGSNSLTENLKLSVQGNARSLTIRSFN